MCFLTQSVISVILLSDAPAEGPLCRAKIVGIIAIYLKKKKERKEGKKNCFILKPYIHITEKTCFMGGGGGFKPHHPEMTLVFLKIPQ